MNSLRTVAFATAFVALSSVETYASSVTLTGSDALAGSSFSTAQLAGMATPLDTVTYDGLTGLSLWSLLGGSTTTTTSVDASGTTKNYGQIITFNPTGANTNPNFDLRYYVVGTGGNGAQSVVSLGQIDHGFVGTANPAPFVAYQKSDGTLLATPQLVIPGAPAGSTVQDLTNLNVASVAAPQKAPSGQSASVTVTGHVANPNTTYSTFPGSFSPVTVNVVNATNQVTNTYTGIPLAEFLNVLPGLNPYNQIVVARGTDNYEIVYSLSELLNADGTPNLNVLLAFAATGADFPGSGIARTIVASDGPFKHGRWESNLVSLDVVDLTPTPIPATLPLFASGLALIGLCARRRKKPAAVCYGQSS